MTRPSPAPGEIPGLRSGAEVAEMLGPLIAELSPRETALLTMSAPVLTIAGLKPAGYVTDAADTYGLAEKLFGRFPDPQVTFFGTQEIGGQLIVHNFQALERITRTSKLPGIIPYDGASGLRGLIEYREAQKEAFEFMISIGAYHPGTLAESLMQGLETGYPDQAILDFEHARANIGRGFWEALRLMRIDCSPTLIWLLEDGYDMSAPDFYVYPTHASDPDVLAYLEAARTILDGFAASPLGRALQEDPLLGAARAGRLVTQWVRRGISQSWPEIGPTLMKGILDT